MNPPTVECPDFNGSGKHHLSRWTGYDKCASCDGKGEIARVLFDELVRVAVNEHERRRTLQDRKVVREEVLGVPTDFLFTSERVGDAIELKVSWIPPAFEIRRSETTCYGVFPPN